MRPSPWWKGAVIYQVYLRSFCDSNGDGQGDLAGLIGKLDYIAALGVDAIWLSPVHPSPNRDWGYDVSDYENVHPDYGTLEDFAALIEAAHARGLKVILDEVLAHTSDEHAWFRESLDAKSDKAGWYVWADPKADGTAPNNWLSEFGGAAWAYQPARRQYFHHKFLRQQPKLNWNNAGARKAALKVLDTWLDRGADGFRLDVANAFLHDPSLADNPPLPADKRDARAWSHAPNLQIHLHDSNLPENAKLLDEIRHTVERHDDRFVFGEFFEDAERSGGYLSSGKGLHSGYTFAMIVANVLSPGFVRDQYAILSRYPDHWPCVSFSNHDVPRTVTRFGGGMEGDPGLAKLMLALLLTLRGTVLLYQGEELGLPQVDLARGQLRDPVGDLYYPIAKGRDGCRTPMPWDDAKPNLGFSTGTPWLPPGGTHAPLCVARQERTSNSVLNFARECILARKSHPALRLGTLEMWEAPPPLLVFARCLQNEKLLCVFNLSRGAASFATTELPDNTAMLLCGQATARPGGLDLAPLGFAVFRL